MSGDPAHHPNPSSVPGVDVDPFSMDFFEDPHPSHETLREAGPVVWFSQWGVFGVARYAEVHAVLTDPGTYCSGRGVGLSDFAKEAYWRTPSIILEADPPAHGRTRAVLQRVLSPAVMKTIREQFAARAEELADALVKRGSIDAIADLAEAYPLSVFPDALGLRPDGRDHLLPYAGLVFNAFGPPNELRRRALERSAPHISYIQAQCLRENLSGGGFGAAIYAAADAGEIEESEAALLVRSLLSAGLDTTVNGLAAALYCLGRFPDQFEALRADPSLARNAFEEAIRFESPVQTFFRTTTRASELGGMQVPADQKILMFLGAANRDPRRWDEPDRFDVTRRTTGHVGFGAGVHMCVGQLVARLEGEVMLRALAERCSAIEITGAPTRRYNNTLRGLESLPVTLKAA